MFFRSKHKKDCSSTKLGKGTLIQQRSINDFDFVKNEEGAEIILGKGAFSEVKLVKDNKSEEKMAMKIVFFFFNLVFV